MESVYIETSVVSYLVARFPARTVAHQWHVWTKDWWRLRRPYFECVISEEVLREAAAGDPKASRQRLEALSTLTVLRRTRAVDELTLREGQMLKSIEPEERSQFQFANILGRILEDFVASGLWPGRVDNS